MIIEILYGVIVLAFYSIFKNTGQISDEENCSGYCKSCRARGKCARR